MMSLRIIILNI